MIKATVYNLSGEKVKEMDLNPAVFGIAVKPELVTQAVVALQANRRQVLADTKDRSEVAGGGRKPWKQKGTGRARHGSTRSPLWRSGGITFGPTSERNFTQKVNKKANRKAILMCLSDKAANQKIILIDKLELEKAKTKKFFEILQNLDLRDKKSTAKKKEESAGKTKKKLAKKVLVIMPSKDEKIRRATKNVSRLETILANSLNVYDVLQANYLLIAVDSLPVIEKTFVK
ncbi:MAG: 50S ribosomal protein L4 [Candidatus Buchananbacteria bacterium]